VWPNNYVFHGDLLILGEAEDHLPGCFLPLHLPFTPDPCPVWETPSCPSRVPSTEAPGPRKLPWLLGYFCVAPPICQSPLF
jgi:hypothetical protein